MRYDNLGNRRRAVWYYSKALELMCDDTLTRCWRGLAHYRLGHWGEARVDLETALQSDDLDRTYFQEERDLARQYLAAMHASPDKH